MSAIETVVVAPAGAGTTKSVDPLCVTEYRCSLAPLPVVMKNDESPDARDESDARFESHEEPVVWLGYGAEVPG